VSRSAALPEENLANCRPAHGSPAGAQAFRTRSRRSAHLPAGTPLPSNITLLPLPPRSPELSSVEIVGKFRDNWLSNRIFCGFDDEVRFAANG
jgi:hypothetical protein